MNGTAFDRTFTHHTTEVNGVRLHYVMGGNGDPVVLLHGWPQTWYAWHKIMPALAQRYTYIPEERPDYLTQQLLTFFDEAQ